MQKKKNLARRSERTSRRAAKIYFFSVKTNRHQICESWGELFRCMDHEFEKDVTRYETQPISTYFQLDGRRVKYTPDFLVELSEGRYRWEEVKPGAKIDDAIKCKLAALNRELDTSWTNIELINSDRYKSSIKTRNLERLYRYMRFEPEFSEFRLKQIKKLVGTSVHVFGDLARSLRSQMSIPIAHSWWLIGAGYLATDHTKLIDAKSLVKWRNRK